jgi:hypothetical protein
MYAEGNYRVRIASQALTTSSNGNLQLSLGFRPIQKDGEPFQGAYDRTLYLSLTPNTIGTLENPGWVTRTLKQMGYDRQDLTGLDTSSPNFFDFTGREYDLYCTHEEYDGKDREKWAVSKGRRQQQPADPSTVSQLLGKLDSDALKGGPASPPAPDQNHQDIPF